MRTRYPCRVKILITGGSGFIGTNAVAAFAQAGHELLNFSKHAPLDETQSSFWRQGDILDADATAKAFEDFQPEWVLHLAARADCDENTTVEQGYAENTKGTKNVLEAIRATVSVRRSIITSTQFVCAPGRLPTSDTDYFPETVYGQSKVITEQLTRAAKLSSCWTIIRPTNVWGPWHLRYRREFWRVLRKGLYFHPGRGRVVRSYAYVGNVIFQIGKILTAPRELVDRQTIYVGDRPIDLLDWVNGFSRALTGRNARVLPRALLRVAAVLGDIPTALSGKPFFINSSRFRSMITDYDTPMERTFEMFGENPHAQEEGIRKTIQWLSAYTGAGRSSGGA